MPQETKSHDEVAQGTAHENLEGWIPSLATDAEIHAALEKAFDFRGDVTITLKDGRRMEGYIFDRRGEAGATGAKAACVRLLGKESDEKIVVKYAEIARLEFSGRDTAAGKSFETWVRKYKERKAAGEKNIGLEPEKLD
jgi:hypothetical protein